MAAAKCIEQYTITNDDTSTVYGANTNRFSLVFSSLSRIEWITSNRIRHNSTKTATNKHKYCAGAWDWTLCCWILSDSVRRIVISQNLFELEFNFLAGVASATVSLSQNLFIPINDAASWSSLNFRNMQQCSSAHLEQEIIQRAISRD